MCFDLSFALRHTPLHLASTLRGFEGLFLKFWTDFGQKRVTGPAVLEVFFKGKTFALFSPILH